MAVASEPRLARQSYLNGSVRPHEPPPSSILAARLAPANGKSTTLDLDRENFTQLLDESLGCDSDRQPNLGNEPVVNHKLIGIIVKAGLEHAVNQPQDPFAGDECSDVESEALRCLEVIQLAVSKCPEVVYQLSTQDEPGHKDHGIPLFVWLIPRLANILVRWDSPTDQLQSALWATIACIIGSETRCRRASPSCRSILRYVQDYIVELTSAVENDRQNSQSECSPDSSGFFAVQTEKLNLHDVSLHSSLGVGTFDDTAMVCCSLINTCLSSEAKTMARASMVARRLSQWSLDIFQRLWQAVAEAIERKTVAHPETVYLLLTTLKAVHKMISSLEAPTTSFELKAGLLWAQCVADCVKKASQMDQIPAEHLLSGILNMTNEVVRDGKAQQALHSILLPIFTSTLEACHATQSLQSLLQDCIASIGAPMKDRTSQSFFSIAAHSPVSAPSHDDHVPIRNSDGNLRPRKRLRLSTDDEDRSIVHDSYQELIRRVYRLLGSQEVSDLTGLSEIAPTTFRKLSEKDQCQVIAEIGLIPCAGSKSLHAISKIDLLGMSCRTCDEDLPLSPRALWEDSHANELFEVLSAILSALQKCSKARVLALLALRRLLAHTSDPSHFRLGHTSLGEWCLHSLRSSLREVRIAAGITLSAFMRAEGDMPTGLFRNNRVIGLDFLQSLLSKSAPAVQETCILSLSRIAEISGDEELNIILVRFVEYLGHPNAFLGAVVYNEILRLAQARDATPLALFKPFWRTIAVVMIKNIQNRPVIAQQLCDLLNMKVSSLLAMTQEYTLPYLVLMRKQEIILKIAAAHGSSTTPYELCTQKSNLASILAFLLTQPSADPEESVMESLAAVAPEFKGQELSSWAKLEPILIACELLKAIADAAEGKASKIHQALRLLAILDSRQASRKGDVVGHFLRDYVLAIITELNNTLNDNKMMQPSLEKRRCLGAIGELMKLGKSRLNAALPQIGACLRSAVENEELCDKAFEVWTVMISALKEEDMVPLIDQTLAIVIRFWDTFRAETQDRAHGVIADILKNHGSLIREKFTTMPSLAAIPVMAKFENEIGSLKKQMDLKHQFKAYVERCRDENPTVVEQCLSELVGHLRDHQDYVHQTIISEQPDPIVAELCRSLLDCAIKFASSSNPNIGCLSSQCLGLIGCLDPNRIESVKEKATILVTSNFSKAEEAFDFIMFSIQHVLVKTFLSASNTRSQGFLAWAIQELLKLCQGNIDGTPRSHTLRSEPFHRHWADLPEDTRNVLTPFLTSRYNLTAASTKGRDCSYPIFQPGSTHSDWLRTIVLDLLQKARGENVRLVFEIFSKIINGQDVSIPEFLLPFTALSVIINGTQSETRQLIDEMLHVLGQPLLGTHTDRENLKLCSERVFNVLDHISKWHQIKKKQHQSDFARQERGIRDPSVDIVGDQIKTVEKVLASIPPDLISKRAIECKSFARALYHWEQYIWQVKDRGNLDVREDDLLERLQEIYTQIDEPDGIEGISAHMQVLNIDQQVLEHRSTAQWTAAQSWYEIKLVEQPENVDLQVNLMTCLKESGQHEILLDQFDGLNTTQTLPQTMPFAVEAAWATGQWHRLNRLIRDSQDSAISGDFSLTVGSALLALHAGSRDVFQSTMETLWRSVSRGLTTTNTVSLHACHDVLLKMHALAELQELSNGKQDDREALLVTLDRRLQVLGSYVADKQYLLGLKRAAMQILPQFSRLDLAAAWLTTAKLARKSNFPNQAFSAVLHASLLGDKSSTIEHAKLMWKEGHHRKAIQSLEGAIDSKVFAAQSFTANETDSVSVSVSAQQQQSQNIMTAKASLLLARWLDSAGQTSSDVIVKNYRQAVSLHRQWEKGHYALGRHYNKLLDSERSKPTGKESEKFLSGEQAKLVIDNYLRSLTLGCKYVFQTMPKVLTLWMELLAGTNQPRDPRRGNEQFQNHCIAQRKKIVHETNAQMEKYLNRFPPVTLYTILPQVVARICHPNPKACDILVSMVVKVVRAFPNQAMWTLLAVLKSSSKERSDRGKKITSRLAESASKSKTSHKEASAAELNMLLVHGQKLSDELLRVSEHAIDGKPSKVSLSRDLGFNHKIAPSKLVVPIEAALTPAFPNSSDAGTLKRFKAFPKELVTITAFLDQAAVLPSLQRPRKLTLKASDGKLYSLMAKPKDDLRKDARLMEFNTTVNRFLSKDVEAARRRLYIRTYSVVPLNEECGLLEWVENLKTIREIILNLYKERNVPINFFEIRDSLNEAIADPNSDKAATLFTETVLPQFPAVFQDWFVETFPDPSAWLAARLRYTRSCAVMSMVGHVLGLGDRHGENILLEEDSAGVLHVDFNCLFDKGLTFEKPETVPFRITHNMTAAMGVYGYEGPWRRCAEITLALLRANEDALMTGLETFVYDPTTDFGGPGGGRKRVPKIVDGVEVPGTPEAVLEGVRGKVRGMLPNESIPLSVGGYVNVMVGRATDPGRLARMYIGWCAFL